LRGLVTGLPWYCSSFSGIFPLPHPLQIQPLLWEWWWFRVGCNHLGFADEVLVGFGLALFEGAVVSFDCERIVCRLRCRSFWVERSATCNGRKIFPKLNLRDTISVWLGLPASRLCYQHWECTQKPQIHYWFSLMLYSTSTIVVCLWLFKYKYLRIHQRSRSIALTVRQAKKLFVDLCEPINPIVSWT